MAGKKKEYTNGEVTVVWEPERCFHSTNCWRQLPQVFQPQNRPWVDMDGAATERIKEQVDRCPSGALSWYMDADGPTPEFGVGASTFVEVMKNGPILIKGEVEVSLPDGSTETKDRVTAFCRCGASKKKPYCDGMHNKIGFKDPE